MDKPALLISLCIVLLIAVFVILRFKYAGA